MRHGKLSLTQHSDTEGISLPGLCFFALSLAVLYLFLYDGLEQVSEVDLGFGFARILQEFHCSSQRISCTQLRIFMLARLVASKFSDTLVLGLQ